MTPAAGTVYMAVGPSFVNVGADGVYTLDSALKPNESYDWTSDKLYLVDPESCEAAQIPVFVEGAWFDENNGYIPCGEDEISLGTGFQTELASEGVGFVGAGQVFMDAFSVENEGKVYMFVVNATGRTISWDEIGVSGDYDWTSDKIYIVNPESCEAENVLVNVDGAWYDENNGYAPYSEDLNVGEGFQTEFAGQEVSIDFPAAIAE